MFPYVYSNQFRSIGIMLRRPDSNKQPAQNQNNKPKSADIWEEIEADEEAENNAPVQNIVNSIVNIVR